MPYSVKDIEEMIASVDRLGKATVHMFTATNQKDVAALQQASFEKYKERLEKVKKALSEGDADQIAKAQTIAEKIQKDLTDKIDEELPTHITIPPQMKNEEQVIATEYNQALTAYKDLDSRLTDSIFDEMFANLGKTTAAVPKGKAPAASASSTGGDVTFEEIEALMQKALASKPESKPRTQSNASEASNTSPASKVDPEKALMDALEAMQKEALALIKGMDEQIKNESKLNSVQAEKYAKNPPMGKFTEQHVNMAFEGTKKVLGKPGVDVEQTVRSMCKFLGHLNDQITKANAELGRSGDVSSSAYSRSYYESIEKFKETSADLMVSKKTVTSTVSAPSGGASLITALDAMEKELLALVKNIHAAMIQPGNEKLAGQFTLAEDAIKAKFARARGLLSQANLSDQARQIACQELKQYYDGEVKPMVNKVAPSLGMGSGIANPDSKFTGAYKRALDGYEKEVKSAGVTLAVVAPAKLAVPGPSSAPKVGVEEKKGLFGIFKKN